MKATLPRRVKKVRIERDNASIDFELHPIPLGYAMALSHHFVPPTNGPKFKNGVQVPGEKDDYYYGLLGILHIAKALQPSGILETQEPRSSADMEAYAEALIEEFDRAGLVQADVNKLFAAVNEVNSAEVDALGKP